MKDRRTIVTVLACLFAAGAVGYAVVVLWGPSAGPSQPDPLADTAGVARLEAIESFVAADTPSDATRIADGIVERVDASLDEARNEGAHVPNESQLRVLVHERVRLTLDPEYDAYVRHVGDLLGHDGASALEGTMFGDPKLWAAFAQPNLQAEIAIDPVRAALEQGALSQDEGMAGGQRTSITDPGIYGSVALAEGGADRVDVEIPMMLPPTHDGPDASIMLVVVTMSFVYDPSRGVWLPYKTSTHDPTGTHTGLAAMWI